MPLDPHPPVPLPLRALRVSLVLGALVDISGGLALLLRPEATSAWFGVPVVGTLDFWPSYAAVFLFVLPLVYLVTALNPARLLPNVGVAIVGRLMGAVAYALWYLPLDKPPALLGMVALNTAFALYYWSVLKPWGRAQLMASLRVSNQP
jgi:hypothetical protein